MKACAGACDKTACPYDANGKCIGDTAACHAAKADACCADKAGCEGMSKEECIKMTGKDCSADGANKGDCCAKKAEGTKL